MNFCSICNYYLYLETVTTDDGITMQHKCRHCGFTKALNPQSSEEALILETTFQKGSSSDVSQITEFTKRDPTLPTLVTISCPNGECPSQADESLRKIIYMKVDAKQMQYQYCCMSCDTQWKS